MATKLGELADAVGWVAQLPGIAARSIAAGSELVEVDGVEVRVVSVQVHADGHPAGFLLAARWDLDEEWQRVTDHGDSGGGCVVWRTWSGFVRDGSRLGGMRLRVTAAEHRPHPPADPAAADPVLTGEAVA